MQIMHNSAGFGEYPRQTLHNPAHYAKPLAKNAFGFKDLQRWAPNPAVSWFNSEKSTNTNLPAFRRRPVALAHGDAKKLLKAQKIAFDWVH